MTERRGAYVTFDGGEGCGKTTQIKLFAERLGVKTIREPGETPAGQDIRSALLFGNELTPEAELFLFCADRTNTLHTVTLPAIASGQSVLSDRSYLSTLAYQSYGRGLPLDYAHQATALAVGDHLPDMQVIFDIDPEVAFERMHAAGKNTLNDRLESETQEFHQKVRSGLLDLAKELGSRALVVDASGPVDEVHATLASKLDDLLINGVPA